MKHDIPEIRFYNSKKKAILLMLSCVPFIIVGIYFISKKPMLGWGSVVIFGFSFIMGIINLLDNRPNLIINEIGIYARSASRNYIVWELIQDAYFTTITGQKYICLIIDKRFKPSQTKGMLYRSAVKLNEAIGAQEMNIYLGQIKHIDEEKLTDLILKMSNADTERKAELLNSYTP
ncbi:STM3941 family protein [Croceitalea marina]|uniref:STM3941 family protein n=1 Tax=Croceitalea marina TaxID=1775166 RepID=A0ABW5MSA0_9FLAO